MTRSGFAGSWFAGSERVVVEGTRQRSSVIFRCRSARALAGAAVCAVALAACSSSSLSPSGQSGSGAVAAPTVPTPLATSIQGAGGTWAAVPMGHLDQPLNTFWQLFFRPTSSDSWSDKVQVTAVATNGGLVLASPGSGGSSATSGASLLVGVPAAYKLTFSPLVFTSDAGKSWSPGLLPGGLAKHPDALAVAPSGQALALVYKGGGAEVLSDSGGLSSWSALSTASSIAKSDAGRRCGVASVTAVAYIASVPLIGASCTKAGSVGIFTDAAGNLRALGPTLPSSLAGGDVEVLSLTSSGTGTVALLASTTRAGSSLVGAWTTDGGQRWNLSAPLDLPPSETVASYGPGIGNGEFVLAKDEAGAGQGGGRIEVVSGPGKAWSQLPTAPAGTATLAFGASGRVEALAVDDTLLTVWSLDGKSSSWVKGQVVSVPVQFGSSS